LLGGEHAGAGARRTQRIIAFPKHGNEYTELLYAEVESRGVPVIAGVWSFPWLIRNLRRGDVLHVHWLSLLYVTKQSRLRTGVRVAKLWAMFAYAKLRGVRFVWTAHNLYPHDGGSQRLEHRIARKIATSLADYVCVHGAAAGELVSQELNVAPSRLLIGHHAHWIDLYPNELTRAESRARLRLSEEEFSYLFVGRCRPYKGLEALIEAFAQAPRPSRLIIAGAFASTEYLEHITGLVRDNHRISFRPGSIPDTDLQLYLNAADCVVLPYRDVLTSGSVMLALSFGRPVIAPGLGAIRDHVDAKCGVLYRADEPQGLARAMWDIRSRTYEAERIIAHARRFTWAQLANLLLEVRAA
jgi:glycosyltransferase involved in cell wall biosynthesis